MIECHNVVDHVAITDTFPVQLQAVGYMLVLGYGMFFAMLTIVLTIVDKSFLGTRYDSEGFNTAGRSIKTGLIAVDVVSHWTW